MQTFLPYPNFVASLSCLDYRRLGKQRVEAMQILQILEDPQSQSRWRTRPAVKMWRGHEAALRVYHDTAIRLWVERGYRNTMKYRATMSDWHRHRLPCWLNEDFCAAHRSNLLRKDPEYYGQFGWTEPPDLPYLWPIKGGK